MAAPRHTAAMQRPIARLKMLPIEALSFRLAFIRTITQESNRMTNLSLLLDCGEKVSSERGGA